MDVSAIALRGLEQAQAQLEVTAGRLARATAGTPDPPPADVVDPSAEMVALMEARALYTANVRVLSTAGEMQKHVMDVLL